MGRVYWVGSGTVRNTYDETDQGYPDIPKNEEPENRAVQLLLGHTKLESTVRHLEIEVDDALEIAEQLEVGGVQESMMGPQTA